MTYLILRYSSGQRLETEVIEDRVFFDNAPPAAIQKHFHACIEQQGFYLTNTELTDPSLRKSGTSAYRFCIIIDAEALQKILRFPTRPTSHYDVEDHIGVKVLDVECHAGSMEHSRPFDEGWLWTSPRNLPVVGSDCSLLAPEGMREDDNLGRPFVGII
jgi:hypothetical protein